MSLPSINLCIIATGKYRQFLEPMLAGARKFFCPEFARTVHLWTDEPPGLDVLDGSGIAVIPHHLAHEPWPGVTLHRYRTFAAAADSLLATGGWTFYCDVDVRFCRPVGEEILGALVAVRHPGYANSPPYSLPYEKNPLSLAFVPPWRFYRYYAGGFQGGRTSVYLNVARELAERIQKDEENGITAVWHDESHWQWYLSQNQPLDSCLNGRALELPPDYCAGEGCAFSNQKTARILSLKKDNKGLQV